MRLAIRDRLRHVLNLSARRYAALSTPMLWSSLEFGHHTTNMDHHIDSWIQRAHSYPLSLAISVVFWILSTALLPISPSLRL